MTGKKSAQLHKADWLKIKQQAAIREISVADYVTLLVKHKCNEK